VPPFPIALTVPILAGVIVFAVAVGTTQIALQVENREADLQTERLARVYLDGLATAVGEYARAGDWPRVERQFRTAFSQQEGVAEVALFAIDPSGRPLAQFSSRPGLAPIPKPTLPGPTYYVDRDIGLAWAMRELDSDGIRLVAALDIGPLLYARRNLLLGVIATDLVIALLCGLGAFIVLRRFTRPTETMLGLLQDAAQGLRRRFPVEAIEASDARTKPLLRAYNDMIDALNDRERLRADIAERGRNAALGRLAATMAHEVRNPLGGLHTAVSTLRKFGDDPKARADSLAFLSRGIETIDTIVTRMLNFHRPEDERRLTRADFEDLRLLVRPAASKRNVDLVWKLDLVDEFAVGASGVRQVLLNLLLNACTASPVGGKVVLAAHEEDGQLVCTISDEGPGMKKPEAERLLGSRRTEATHGRIGIDAVVSLLGDLAGTASVDSTPGGGTTIRIVIPKAEV
jgi:two-component system OmpR family sensor kinase